VEDASVPGVPLLRVGARLLDDVLPVPPAPGIDLDAPPPAPDPADPHVGSPLFTSVAALRLLRAQASVGVEEGGLQYFLALEDVGHCIAAVVVAPGQAPLQLPAVGPVEPAPPRFREVWLECAPPQPHTAGDGAGDDAARPSMTLESQSPPPPPPPPPLTPTPVVGGLLLARSHYYGGVPAAECLVTWIRVAPDGTRSETAPRCCTPHTPVPPAAVAAGTPHGVSDVDPRVYRLPPSDVGAMYKVHMTPVRLGDGESGAPSTSRPTAEAVGVDEGGEQPV
jgi:hypothetical protein